MFSPASCKLAIFDLDGTLLNTLDDLASSVNVALASRQLPSRTLNDIRSFVGNGIRKLIQRACPPEASPDMVEQVYRAFCEHYAQHNADQTTPYDGIPQLLAELKRRHILTAVVSNKADFAVQKLCAHFFPGTFAAIAGERDGIRRKPAPDAVNTILQQLDIPRENAVYIGDSDVDVLTAANADLPCIAVTWGFRDRDCLLRAGATIFADHPRDILELC